jgi:hypothetical protein
MLVKLSQYYLTSSCRYILSVHTWSLITQWSSWFLAGLHVCVNWTMPNPSRWIHKSVRRRLQFHLLLSSSTGVAAESCWSRYGDRGQPCRMPLLLLKWLKDWPLIMTEKVGEEMQACTRLMKWLWSPFRAKAEAIKCVCAETAAVGVAQRSGGRPRPREAH